MFDKKAETSVPITETLANRWSGRAFDPNRTISHTELSVLLEAARWTPSSKGYQPWRFVISDKQKTPAAWQRTLDSLVESNQSWAKSAPVLMAVFSDLIFEDGSPNKWALYDTGAAVMSLATQATELGLMTHQMGGINAQKIQADLKVPDRYECITVVALGYQIDPCLVPEELKTREFSPRKRRPLGLSFYLGSWENPWPEP